MNERDMRMMYDGRRMPPRNSRGEFRRRRRGDRGMEHGYDGRVYRSYPRMDYEGHGNYDMPHRDYGEDMRGGNYHSGSYHSGQMSDRGEYGNMHHMDGNYPHGRQGGYEPVEFMGYCSGYYGSPRGDYGYGGMRGYRDYGYDYGYGDYGETLSEKEMDEWCHKLKSHLDDRERQMFSKEMISQKAKQLGMKMEDFGEKELEVATLLTYTDYKGTIGQNPDLAIKLAYDWLTDKDVKVKGAEKLAVYYDEIVMGGE